MSGFDLSTIDFVRELRLRQWARQHFVPQVNRKDTWHPVVLDEMRRRDLELRNEQIALEEHQSIAPAVEYVDSLSEIIPASPLRAELTERNWGSTFVPLAPSTSLRFDCASFEAPKPHGRMLTADSREVIETPYSSYSY